MKSPSSAEIPSTPFKFIWFSIKPYQKWFWWIIFFVSTWELFSNFQHYAFKGFIDATTMYSSGQTDSIKIVFFWVLSIPVLMFLSTLAARGWGYMLNYLAIYSRTRATKILFEYLSLHSMSYFNDRFSGDLSNRVGAVSMNVSKLTAQFFNHIFGFVIGLIISGILIYSVSKDLLMSVIAGFALLIPFNYWITKKQVGLSEKVTEVTSKLRGQIIDIITNINSVQQYVRRNYEMSYLDKTIAEYRDIDVASENYEEKVAFVNQTLITLFIGAIIMYAFSFWTKGVITLGSFVLIVTLTRGFIHNLSNVGRNFNMITRIYGEVKAGLRELILPHDITDKPHAKKLVVDEGKVAFENVTFAYDKDSQKINVNSTGFGLAFVKGVAEAHKGRVWADSTGVNKGSQFFMELPISS